MSVSPFLFASVGMMMLQLGIALTIAWAKFGKAPHIALWATGFFAISGTYLVSPVAVVWPGYGPVVPAVANGCGMICVMLMTLGFRFRSGRRKIGPVLAAAIGPAVVLTIACVPLDANWVRVVPTASAGVLYLASAHALRTGPRSTEAAARATFWQLVLFAAFQTVCATLAARISPAHPQSMALFHLVTVLGVPVGMTGLGLFTMLLVASDLADRLRRIAAFDPLTGVLNRRGFETAAKRLAAQGVRSGRPMTIVLADLDRFKAINDGFGHPVGDAVLRCFARHCGAMVRGGDVVGRLGGEEFAILMPDAGTAVAAQAMERLRAELPAALEAAGLPAIVTASFGVAAFSGRGDTLASMLQRADDALYASKGDGRDRITFAPQEPATDDRFLKAFARAS